jgi:hypothetical protein
MAKKLRTSNAAADQNRQNSFLIASNRLLDSRCELGGSCAFRALRDIGQKTFRNAEAIAETLGYLGARRPNKTSSC